MLVKLQTAAVNQNTKSNYKVKTKNKQVYNMAAQPTKHKQTIISRQSSAESLNRNNPV